MTFRVSRRAVLGAALLLAGGMPALAQDNSQPIRIGWLSSLTGPLSSAAIAENVGVQFAVDEINAAGGINGRKLELVTRDTMGDPTKAVNFAQQLAFSEKVDFVIGPVNSGESLAAVPILSRAGIPNIIIGTVDELTNPQLYPRAFRAINTNTQWVGSANAYAVDKLKASKIAIIGDTTGYGTATVKQAEALLKERGIEPVYSALVDANKTDLTDELGKARAAGAEVVMPWSAATGLLGRILNTRGEMNWDVPVVGHPAIMGTPIRALLNKPEYWENTYAAGYASTTYDETGKFPERTQALMDAVRPKLGGKIDFTFWWIALGYDTVKIIEHAVKTAGSTDGEAVQKALEDTKDLKLVYATYSWGPEDRNGFPDADIVINLANTFRDGGFKAAPNQ
ncbi:ABC transporter substrate-binding protein [Rhodoligotrophos ferricapiens]|uniref:ABC transporter substrate-binding protein n=1 Tax=Rhodoligotrophos ferricapiens TaxID=3069264 RepID=UPI00315DBEF1